MNEPPADAKRLTPAQMAQGFIDVQTGLANSWTVVQASGVAVRTQTEEGAYQGKTIYEVEYRCPRCSEIHRIHTLIATGSSHPAKCHCNGSLVFTVTW